MAEVYVQVFNIKQLQISKYNLVLLEETQWESYPTLSQTRYFL